MTELKTIVFGIDGAHFELIQPWLDQGKLPNIRALIETGVSADLEAVLPPVTSPNWKAYSTGKNPGKLGIFWWENVDTEKRRVYYPSERKHQQPELWELIGQSEPSGVIGVPTTHPPKPLDSFLVAGAPDGEDDGFASPDDVERQLVDELDYRIRMRSRFEDDKEKAAEEVLTLIELRYRAAQLLLAEYDISFLQVTTFYINSLHHYLWNDEYTLRGWKIIDRYVGDLSNEARNVVLMSDHGSNEIQGIFNVNAWLRKEGYLNLRRTFGDRLYELGINRDRLRRISDRIGLTGLFRNHAPSKIWDTLSNLPDEEGTVQREAKTDFIDWDGSTAVASGQGPIYLTVDESDPNYEETRTDIREKLTRLTFPGGGKIAANVFSGEEVYSGEYLDEAPDLVIDQSPGTHVSGDIGRETVFSHPHAHDWRAENKRHGLFIANGRDFGRGTLDTISILDLAPTMLHLHGTAIPESMDGEVQKSVFADESPAMERVPEYQQIEGSGIVGKTAPDTDGQLRERLSDLGYLQ